MKKGLVIYAIFVIKILLISNFAFAASAPAQTAPTPSTTTKITKYFYAGTLVASKSSDSSTTQYYIQDYLGSNMKVFDNGILEQTNKYYAFGETTSTDKSKNKYLYTGKELDKETGLYYYGARYYKPEIGRFVQVDAMKGDIKNPASMNRYAYVSNNPMKFVDPSGNLQADDLGVNSPSAINQEYAKVKDKTTGSWALMPGMALFAAAGFGTAATWALVNPVTASGAGIAATEVAMGDAMGPNALSAAAEFADESEVVVNIPERIKSMVHYLESVNKKNLKEGNLCATLALNNAISLRRLGESGQVKVDILQMWRTDTEEIVGHAVTRIIDQRGVEHTGAPDVFFMDNSGVYPGKWGGWTEQVYGVGMDNLQTKTYTLEEYARKGNGALGFEFGVKTSKEWEDLIASREQAAKK